MSFRETIRILALGALVSAGAGVFYYGFLWDHYYDALPRSPERASDRIYAMNMRGRLVYATHGERHKLRIIDSVSGALALFGVAAYILTGKDYWQKMGWRYPKGRRAPASPDRSPPEPANKRDESERSH